LKKPLSILIVSLLLLTSCKHPNTKVLPEDWTDYKKAYSFLNRNKDSAFYYFNKVAANLKDSQQVAMAYYSMATLQQDAGDNFGSQESLSMSLKFLNEHSPAVYRSIATNYNELGLTSYNLKNYNEAIGFYNQAIEFSRDHSLTLYILNNLANAYQKKQNYQEALLLYAKVLTQKDLAPSTYARISTNIATTKWLANANYNAAPALLEALYIRMKENDIWGQNSSYAHLADYYARSHPDSSLIYANKMYSVARRLNSPDDQLEALQKLIELSPPRSIRLYFARYQQLNDSVQTTRNAAKNQFAFIRYQAEKSKADNVKLQKDNTEKKYQIFKQGLMLYGTIFASITLAIFATFWYRRRKQRLEIEAKNTIRENELKTSKKVHDVVANGLYRILSEVENQDEIDKGLLLDRMEVLYERSRDISYEAPQSENRRFHEKLTELILSFATANRKVVLVGNNEAFWGKANPKVGYELEHVLQELMVNMKKHSHANNVVVKFEEQGNRLLIYYSDDGIGFAEGSVHKNGLTSTGNRIKAIGGAVIFDSKTGEGLTIEISFPIA